MVNHAVYGPNSAVVSPDGKQVFATASNDDSLAAFRRDPATGRLTFAEMIQEGQNGMDGLDVYHGALDPAAIDDPFDYNRGWPRRVAPVL